MCGGGVGATSQWVEYFSHNDKISVKEVLTPETQRELTEVSKERHLPAGFCKKQTLKKKNAL